MEHLYETMSKKLFSLGDVFNKLSSNYTQLQKLSDQKKEEGGPALMSDSYNFFKITLYAWSNQIKLNSDGVLKLIEPFCKSNLQSISRMKEVRNEKLDWIFEFFLQFFIFFRKIRIFKIEI